jgi:solute carrier family 26 (sodium-independent sulfate anion transporter), member 11
LFALGMVNVIGSFFSALPCTGSFSRAAVISACGVRSLLAQLFSAAIVLVAMLGMAPAFYYIPQSALAAMVIVAISNMIDTEV